MVEKSVAQMIKNLHLMQEIYVRLLGQEDPPGEENGYLLHYSCLENSMDRGVWWATVHGVAESQTWLSDYHSVIVFSEKSMLF